MSAEARLVRLVAWLLKRGETVTFEEVRQEFPEDYAGDFAAAERKWTRDKNTLIAAGVPIVYTEFDPDQPPGYHIERDRYRLQFNPTPEERVTLWTAGWAALRLGGLPWREDLLSALGKLRGASPDAEPAPERLTLHHGAPKLDARQSRWLEQLGDAVARRKRVRIRYFGLVRQEETTRDVEVYGVAFRQSAWLFVGRCLLRDDLRVFFLHRVRSLTVSRARPAEPDYEIPEGFDVRSFAGQRPWQYWYDRPREARVVLRGDLAPLAGSLFPDGEHETVDGAAHVRLEVRNLDGLVGEVLALGPDAELAAPEEGRARLRAVVDGLLARLEAEEAQP